MVGLAHVGDRAFERPQQTDGPAVGTSEEIEGFGALLTGEDVDVFGGAPPASRACTAAMTSASLSNRQVTRLASANRYRPRTDRN